MHLLKRNRLGLVLLGPLVLIVVYRLEDQQVGAVSRTRPEVLAAAALLTGEPAREAAGWPRTRR
jgi:hypothetical protein